MYRVKTKKAVFDIEGRKQSGELVIGLEDETITILINAGLIEEVVSEKKPKKAKFKDD